MHARTILRFVVGASAVVSGLLGASLRPSSAATKVAEETDGKVTVISSNDPRLCEISFPETASCKKGERLRVFRRSGNSLSEVGVLEVVAVSGKKIVGRCAVFNPRAGDVVQSHAVPATPTKHRKERPGTKSGGTKSAADAKVAMALEEPISLDAVEMPLSEVIDYLSHLRGIPIVIDAKALGGVGLADNVPVTFSVEHVKLKALLVALLEDLGLMYDIKGGTILITAKNAGNPEGKGTVAASPGPSRPKAKNATGRKEATAELQKGSDLLRDMAKAFEDRKRRKERTAEINYTMDYVGFSVRGKSTFTFAVTVEQVDQGRKRALVRLENIRRYWTAIRNGGISGPRETNITSMPYTDPRGYKVYGAPASWGSSVKVGDTAWISLTELKNKRGNAGVVTETGKAGAQMAAGVLVVGGVVVATSGKAKGADAQPSTSSTKKGRLVKRYGECPRCHGRRATHIDDLVNARCSECNGMGACDVYEWEYD